MVFVRKRIALVALIGLLLSPAARAELTAASPFTDNMVLQRDLACPVWGKADAGQKVEVKFGQQAKSATADADGKWMLKLDPLPASHQPAEMTITAGDKTLTLKNILVGDVWICSGQSNMAFGLGSSTGGKEAAEKANIPGIRLLMVPKRASPEPVDSITIKWSACTPETAVRFSAVGFYFGRDLHEKLKVPIGLIHTNYGGTPAQAWTSKSALAAVPELAYYIAAAEKMVADFKLADLQKQVTEAKAAGKPVPTTQPRKPNLTHLPGGLYNAMIHPLVPFGIRGAIWYQGEANAGNVQKAIEYRTLLPAMIKDWRTNWGQGDFPFLFVQLANFREPPKSVPQAAGEQPWAMLREAQTRTLSLPNTAMAVIIDVGEAKDIHPRDKLTVGQRLALGARAVAYGEKLIHSGPTFDAMKVDANKAVLSFKNIGGGLVARGSAHGNLSGFTIAGADGKFVTAAAKIEGDTVVVTGEGIATPAAVRYNWANNPDGNLYNKEDLPAVPFRTDLADPRATMPAK
ncbi:MAG: sialate O-acetylesterase [Lentisphaerae bacterium]|nr:sialate O-acetylesterase [Lentisphaerota bacterium]